ncbi:hypothetical protein CAEBREN_08540 [Caenorhabditis brenneri]|uniref:Uncharacterized protein n=1 Tax=Caenorhabditis brenneri TaxID=135651 RepID=G0NGB5_CAEBE|nr:hypothetical protein CAEBREN_08540 [Caenorhabditis brenneri]
MGILEVFILMFCSEDIYNAVKRLLGRNKDKYQLKMCLRTVHHTFIVNDEAFYLVKPPKNFKRETFTASMDGSSFKKFIMEGVMMACYADVEIGMRAMICYFSKLYYQGICQLHYGYFPKTITSNFAMIDFLLNHQGKNEFATVQISKLKVEFKQFFKRLTNVETMTFDVSLGLQLNVHDGLTWQRDDMREVLEDRDCEENPIRVLKTLPYDTSVKLTTPMDIRQNGETIDTVFFIQRKLLSRFQHTFLILLNHLMSVLVLMMLDLEAYKV